MSDKKGLLDRVLRFMGIEEEVAASTDSAIVNETNTLPNASAVEDPPAHHVRRRSRVNAASAATEKPSLRMIVLNPNHFDDVQSVADHLINREPVVLSLEKLDKDTSRRIMDFLGGTTYALGGHIQRLGDNMFVLAPSNVEVDTQTLFSIDPEDKEHLS